MTPAELAPIVLPDTVSLSIGFNDDPDCDFLEATVPDTSDPPSIAMSDGSVDSLNLTQTLKRRVGTMTAEMLKMARPEKIPATELSDTQDMSVQIAEAVRKHYYLEERAVKIALCVRNDGNFDVQNLTIEISLPRLAGFEVAHRLYTNPFNKSSEAALSKLDYPSVVRKEDAIIVKTRLASLPATRSQPLFGTALRAAVGAEALGRKIALQYVVRRSDGKRVGDGRLKIRLGQRPEKTAARGGEQTAYHNLDED